MRLHVVSLPHTQMTREYSNCAFATLARGFANMMSDLGHEVIIYAGEDNDAKGELVTCITREEQKQWFNVQGPEDILRDDLALHMYETHQPHWPMWNLKVIQELVPRLQQGDFVCIIGGGVLFPPLVRAVQGKALVLEYAIGYGGVHPGAFHAFGSKSWQHVVFGMQQYEGFRGRSFDRVIPHYFDPTEFEYREEKDDYLLYLGKLKMDKGVEVASRAAELTGQRIIFAGQGPTPIPYGEVLNRRVGPDERRELLAGAKAVLVPSLYTEPFGMVAVEALLSGTPIITSPWGGLGDINVHGTTGFQCHLFRDYLQAVQHTEAIDPRDCYDEGMKYAEENVKHQYQAWLEDLSTLWQDGWMTGWNKEE
jgi:glycosyltransferase involved in cell wall biosynthesis